jgi:hypothetical protein
MLEDAVKFATDVMESHSYSTVCVSHAESKQCKRPFLSYAKLCPGTSAVVGDGINCAFPQFVLEAG